jgi:hypothetical protein
MIFKTLIVTIAILLVSFAFAQEKAPESKAEKTKISGFLIDNMCAEAAEPEEIEGHLVSCALIETCIKSGFAVSKDGKLYKLDEKGNKLAVKVLQATRAKMGLIVAVEGTLKGDVMHADTLVESH